jgi:putative selenate reductase molybdopterin-binding subunit
MADEERNDPAEPEDVAHRATPEDPTRRSFVKAAAGTVVTASALAASGYELARINRRAGTEERTQNHTAIEKQDDVRPVSWADIELRVNGASHRLRLPHHRSLLLALREDLGLTGTKKSCNLGQCGACTVLADGLPVYSCLALAMDAEGREITTVEGLEKDGRLHPVQQGFIEKMGSQCGHCTSGMIMSGVALLAETPTPTPDEVKFALSGNLCRCGNYPNEIASVLAAASSARNVPASSPLSPGIPQGAGYNPPFPGGPPAIPVEVEREQNRKSAIASSRFHSTIPTLDAVQKATGRARYAGDIGFHPDDPFQKPLFAKVLRCPHPHAEVLEIDDSLARNLPGYRGMISYRDVPGYADAPTAMDRRFLNEKARYVGDAVAAVAADDQYAAQEAMNLLRVRYRELKAYPDAEYNLSHAIATIHPGTVAGFGGPQPADKATVEYKRGDPGEGFKQADKIVEGRYVTQIQCHAPIEMHCCTALWQGDQLTVWDSQQSVHAAKQILADVLRTPVENVRVVCETLGGGFGGKCTDTPGKTLYQAIAALLSKQTGRPVRLEYTLKEELFAEDTRNPFVFYFKTGVKKDGTLTAMECKAIQRTGGYASSGPAVCAVAGGGVLDTYRIPNYWYHAYAVYTNSPVGGEMRGFGHPQAVFARETHIDEVAAAVGINPLEFRLMNSLHKGDRIVTDVGDDVPLADIGAEACLRRGAEAIGWNRWEPPSKKSGRLRRGLGIRFAQEHSGRNASDGLVWRDRNGKFHVPIGTGNIGTEAHTGIALIVAEALKVPIAQLDVTWGDSSETAWDYVTDASRSLHCVGKALYNAAIDLKNQIARGGRGGGPRTDFTPYCDPRLDISPVLDETTGKVEQHPAPKVHPVTERLARRIVAEGGVVGLGFYVWNPSAQSWGASFAEVEVDMETGQVYVLKLVGAHDAGLIIHQTAAEAQVHGGGVMGLGYTMTEELLTDPHTGIPVTQTLYEYRPPTILDLPQLVPILVEAPVAVGPYGAKGLGENPVFDAAAAVANAIYNATGVRVGEIPFTWNRVFEALRASGKLEG